jgi:hypothetical protein
VTVALSIRRTLLTKRSLPAVSGFNDSRQPRATRVKNCFVNLNSWKITLAHYKVRVDQDKHSAESDANNGEPALRAKRQLFAVAATHSSPASAQLNKGESQVRYLGGCDAVEAAYQIIHKSVQSSSTAIQMVVIVPSSLCFKSASEKTWGPKPLQSSDDSSESSAPPDTG